ncbi:cell surface glycoprotein [Halomicrobium mukohataei]|uniref:Cell surface glycoprotein n=1 Tax=Halomicrobium mukohataei TaxID=57705 RepID=A0A847U755_9EURY|nr:cell surface glycoprotein [Halomicrobium mukohataei]NLV11573.1 cell surface glycoprotein [Halomicrobium mukohataei]
MRRWLLLSSVVLGALLGAGILGAQSSADYSLSADASVDIPTQEVSYDGDTFEISQTGVADPETTFLATASAPEDADYVVYVVDREESIRQSNSASGSGEVPLDLGTLEPGTYAVTIEQNGTVAAMPLVVRGYDLSQDVPDETTAGTETEISITADAIHEDAEHERIVLTLWDGSEEHDITASRADGQRYTATIPAGTLDPGTYQVVSRAETGATAFGHNELVGISETTTISVTESATPTESGAGGGGGQVSTETATGTPTQTNATTSPTQTPTVTQTPTPSSNQTTTPVSTTERSTQTPGTATTPSETTTAEPTPSDAATPSPTTGEGGSFSKLVFAALLAGVVGTLTIRRRS